MASGTECHSPGLHHAASLGREGRGASARDLCLGGLTWARHFPKHSRRPSDATGTGDNRARRAGGAPHRAVWPMVGPASPESQGDAFLCASPFSLSPSEQTANLILLILQPLPYNSQFIKSETGNSSTRTDSPDAPGSTKQRVSWLHLTSGNPSPRGNAPRSLPRTGVPMDSLQTRVSRWQTSGTHQVLQAAFHPSEEGIL